jgi:hypothetical protein
MYFGFANLLLIPVFSIFFSGCKRSNPSTFSKQCTIYFYILKFQVKKSWYLDFLVSMSIILVVISINKNRKSMVIKEFLESPLTAQ